VLPTVDSYNHYTLAVVRGSSGTGNLEVYILDSDGHEITEKRTLEGDTKREEANYD